MATVDVFVAAQSLLLQRGSAGFNEIRQQIETERLKNERFPERLETALEAAGDGWALVGDAFGFLDPLYSSGVLLALKSGEMAADAITEGLAKGDTSAAQLGKWETEFCRGMDRMRRLVCEFYDGFSFGRFIKKHPHLKRFVTDVLIGDLFKDDVDVPWPLMDEMCADQQPAITESPAASASAS